MTATFWSNFSKRQNSTLQPSTAGTSYTVYLKDNVSVLSPVFLIDGIDLAVTYCRWNGRYYFVRDIILSNNNIYQVSCEIDALATWKTAIGSSSQYVLRSASEFDGDVVDMFYPTKKDPAVERIAPTSSPAWAGSLNAGFYVVGIISGSDSTGGQAGTIQQGCVQYYRMLPADFSLFAQKIFTDANWTDFQTADRYSFNPIQYISSVMWFPFSPSVSTTYMNSVKIGWETFSLRCDLITDPVKTDSYYFPLTWHPQAATRGDYLKSSPFSEYTLSFPPFADVEIDGDLLRKNAALNNTLLVTQQTDFISGRSILVVRINTHVNPTIYYVFARREVQLGVNIQLAQIAANRVGLLQDGVATVGNLIGSLASGNVLGAITGTASGILSAYQTLQPRVLSNGSNDSLLSLINRYTDPYVYEIFHLLVDEDNTDCGRPLCQVKQINTLSGYIMTANAEIALPALPAEREAIISAMNSGFFYE